MSTSGIVWAATSAIVTATAASVGFSSQGGNSQPQPPAKTESPAPAKGAGVQPKWPEHKTKTLHAEDFRGKKAPEIAIEEMLTDKPDRKGKVVLIDLWATWCGPCRKAIPDLNEFQKQFRDDLVVLGISNEQAAKVRQFMKTTEIIYAMGIDTQNRMAKAMSVRGIPHVVIISTDGIVRWQGFPLNPEEPLTATIIKQIIDADPGVKERREAEAAAKPDKSGGKG